MNGKKIFWILVIGFLLFWLFSDPDGLANSAGVAFTQGWDLLQAFFNRLIRFFEELG